MLLRPAMLCVILYFFGLAGTYLHFWGTTNVPDFAVHSSRFCASGLCIPYLCRTGYMFDEFSWTIFGRQATGMG